MSQRPGFPVKLPTAGAARPARSGVSGAGLAKSALVPASAVSPRRVVPPLTGLGLDSGAVRARMVSKLAEQGLKDPLVLQAMGAVERHRFVETALAGQAYEDTSLPIGLGQTISKPNVVARMIELLRQGLQPNWGEFWRSARGVVIRPRCSAMWQPRCTALSVCVDCMKRRARTCVLCACTMSI